MGNSAKRPNTCLWTRMKKSSLWILKPPAWSGRVANVTAVCQYLFAGNSAASKILAEIFGEKNRLELIDALKAYKKNRTRESFENLLEDLPGLAKGLS